MVLFRESETLIHFWQHRVVMYSATSEEGADKDEIPQTRHGRKGQCEGERSISARTDDDATLLTPSSNCDCLVWEDSLQTKASTSSRGESNYFNSLLLGLREQGNQIGKTRGIYVADRNASNLRSAKTNYVKSEMIRRIHFGNV
jgi:hypothetical protein